MDKESIFKLGLGYISNIDIELSYEEYSLATNNHIINIFLKKDERLYCPHCGLIGEFKLRSSITQEFRHSTSLEPNILIKLHRKIFKCYCGKTFREPNPFGGTKRKITLNKEIMILNELRDINASFKSVAKRYNVSHSFVQKLFDSKVNIRRQKLTEVICVDEVYNKHCGYHKYCFIIYSPQLDKILDVLPSRNKLDLIDYFATISINEKNNVKYFSMDLYDVYKQVAELCFPNALICADHFHVIKNLTDHFNSARIRIMKQYEHLKKHNDSWYWLYKKYWRKLLKDPAKLEFKKFKVSKSGMYLDEHQIVDYMLTIDKDLRDAYEILNEYRNFNSVATINNAAEMLDELIIKYHDSNIKELYQSYKLLKKWRTEIINSFNRINGHVISNGGMERANRDIKTIVRIGYGFSNFNRLRNKIMFSKNKDASILGYRIK